MNTYRTVMNRVQVDSGMMERTEQRLREAIAQDEMIKNKASMGAVSDISTRRSVAARNRPAGAYRALRLGRIAIAAVLMAVLLPVGAFAYSMTPVSFLDLDINPSVEIRMNGFGRILDVVGVNDDGKKVLADLKLKGLDLQDVIGSIIQSAHEKGYLGYDKPEAISLTVSDNHENRATALTKAASNAVRSGLGDEGGEVAILETAIGLENVREARKLQAAGTDITPGKLHLIGKLKEISNDASFNPVDWYGRSVQEIMAAAKILKNQTSSGNKDRGAKGEAPSVEDPKDSESPSDSGTGKEAAPGQNKIKENNGKSGKTDEIDSSNASDSTGTVDPSSKVTSSAIEIKNGQSDTTPGQIDKTEKTSTGGVDTDTDKNRTVDGEKTTGPAVKPAGTNKWGESVQKKDKTR